MTKTKVPTTVTNAVSWRSEGIKYKKNEVFIDVIESINVLVSDLFCQYFETVVSCCCELNSTNKKTIICIICA